MRASNLPVGEMGITICPKRPDGTRVIALWCLTSTGDRYRLKFWECASGAPTPGQLLDIQASLDDEVTTTVLTSTGVQGVLMPE